MPCQTFTLRVKIFKNIYIFFEHIPLPDGIFTKHQYLSKLEFYI